MIAPSDRTDLVRGLLTRALQVARDDGVDYLVTTTGRQRLRSLYWELGFESRARSAPALLLAWPDDGSIHQAGQEIPAQAEIEFWHGAMF